MTQSGSPTAQASSEAPEVSVVVPLGSRYEELGAICRGLREVLAGRVKGHEVVFVDDSGTAETRQALRQAAERFPEVRVIRLQRRMGEAAALAIGAGSARGGVLITLDPYLHVAIEELPKLLEPLQEGMDLVCAWRWPRHEGGLSGLASGWFNAAARWLTGVQVHDLNCRTRVLRRGGIEDLPLYGDLHRFLPIFAARRGYRWCEVQVPQQAGKHEVGARDVRSYVGRLLDLLTLAFLTRFVKRPLHLFGLIGLASFLSGLVIALHLAYTRLILDQAIGHRPMLLLAVLLIVVGIQVASVGLLGELMVFTHARDLKDYVVKEEA